VIPSIDSLKRQLVQAARVIVRNGIASGPFGNLSIRVPGTTKYLQNPAGVFFEHLAPSDVVVLDLEHEGTAGGHQGDFIHKQILRRRPDVSAIAHSHCHASVMMCVLGTVIEPFTQVGAALHGDQGLFEGFSGPVRDFEEGDGIAKALGDRSLVLAKRHGIFAAASSMPRAVWDLILADWAAREHLHALQVGLKTAEPLRPQDYAKSRDELREGMFAQIWQNELRHLERTEPWLCERSSSAA
jgi:ribulose-5-phosphate 4-epimerase/fuculose-1-phosphate aldolase